MPTFSTPEPITLRATVAAGHLAVSASDRDDAHVEVRPRKPSDADYAASVTVEFDDGTLVVTTPDGGWLRRTPEVMVTVALPTGSRVQAKTAAADISVSGRVSDVEAGTAAGDIRVEHAAHVRVKSASGDVVCDVIDGEGVVESTSGDVRVGSVRDALDVRSASGDVVVREALGDVTGKTVSGDLEFGSVARGRMTLNSASGDITVGVAQGPAVWLDVSSLSGKTISRLERSGQPGEGEETVEISARSLSGDITITRAGVAR
ncbi:DUF4097 family beta strand repeat-containing protein [Nonomuraea sp. NPDC050556]|uniref:DUF4097 family beta strand repeat-containing protein n=1 Tax=Nonomuraea sp. NPDC050556 TaxID=3364369 RepID=UPI0037AACBD7